MNHPTRSTITCPPAVVVITKPSGDTGTMTDAARGRPVPSGFMNDVVVDTGPAGRTLRNPARRPPTVVTLIAIARASAATPDGSGRMMLVPGATPVAGAPGVLESEMRVGATGTNLPARALLSGTNTPVTSTIRSTAVSIRSVLRTSMAPSSPTTTIAELARSVRARGFNVDVVGTADPAG